MLSSKTVRTFHSIKHELNRPTWKFEELSTSQIGILSQYIKLANLMILDRGSASILIACIFKLRDIDEDISDFTMLEELTKILNDN